MFFIAANGDAFFYPLTEKSNHDGPVEVLGMQSSSPSEPVRGQAGSQYLATDTILKLDDLRHKVYKFSFLFEEVIRLPKLQEYLSAILPRKVSLSPNKRLLLMLGASHNGHSSLLV